MKLLADTNILLRWIETDDPDHESCVQAVDALLRRKVDVCVCAQVLAEFWVVATRPVAVNGLGLTASQARARLAETEETFSLLQEPADIARRWMELVTAYTVLGKQAHDARLVALMAAHDISQLITFNSSDFARYSEITAVTPADVLRRTA